jgi:hypothetical protein
MYDEPSLRKLINLLPTSFQVCIAVDQEEQKVSCLATFSVHLNAELLIKTDTYDFGDKNV